jgi:transcriptional regulator with XRE-family HTH domain
MPLPSSLPTAEGDPDDRFPVARDVARLAGVSTSTVSRVFNGTAAVRADKRDAVLKAAEDLGFVANGAARALSMRRFMAVGAVVPNIENEGFVRTLSSFQEKLRRDGYTLILTNAGYDLDDELQEASFLLERGIDGLILVGDLHRPNCWTASPASAFPPCRHSPFPPRALASGSTMWRCRPGGALPAGSRAPPHRRDHRHPQG